MPFPWDDPEEEEANPAEEDDQPKEGETPEGEGETKPERAWAGMPFPFDEENPKNAEMPEILEEGEHPEEEEEEEGEDHEECEPNPIQPWMIMPMCELKKIGSIDNIQP